MATGPATTQQAIAITGDEPSRAATAPATTADPTARESQSVGAPRPDDRGTGAAAVAVPQELAVSRGEPNGRSTDAVDAVDAAGAAGVAVALVAVPTSGTEGVDEAPLYRLKSKGFSLVMVSFRR
jgi:hypothetical protein